MLATASEGSPWPLKEIFLIERNANLASAKSSSWSTRSSERNANPNAEIADLLSYHVAHISVMKMKLTAGGNISHKPSRIPRNMQRAEDSLMLRLFHHHIGLSGQFAI